ncbi:MAG: hypothetical protein CMP10_03290 [Zetaproteobacteria bacterium]|nr:hypothetical protein [Pseudobdellovibrionaceae bacterium]
MRIFFNGLIFVLILSFGCQDSAQLEFEIDGPETLSTRTGPEFADARQKNVKTKAEIDRVTTEAIRNAENAEALQASLDEMKELLDAALAREEGLKEALALEIVAGEEAQTAYQGSLAASIAEIERIKEELANATEQAETDEETIAALAAAKDDLVATVSSLQASLDSANGELAAARQDLKVALLNHEQVQGGMERDLDSAKTELNNAKATADQLQVQQNKLKDDLNEAQFSIINLNSAVDAAKAAEDSAKAEADAMQQALNAEKEGRAIDAVKAKFAAQKASAQSEEVLREALAEAQTVLQQAKKLAQDTLDVEKKRAVKAALKFAQELKDTLSDAAAARMEAETSAKEAEEAKEKAKKAAIDRELALEAAELSDITAEEAKEAEAKAEIARLLAEAAAVKAEADRKLAVEQAELAKKVADAALAEAKAEIVTLQDKLIDTDNKLAGAKAGLSASQAEVGELEKKVARLEKKIALNMIAFFDFDDLEGVADGAILGLRAKLYGGAKAANDDERGKVLDLSKGGYALTNNGDFLYNAAAVDKITVAFWQKKNQLVDGTSFYVDKSRFILGHAPWGNQQVYFDTAGCCDESKQRIKTDVIKDVDWKKWRHFAFVKDGTKKSIYIDGVLRHTAESSYSLSRAAVGRLYIGSYENGKYPVKGLMDDFAVYASALSQKDITSIVEGSRELYPPKAPKLLSISPAVPTPPRTTTEVSVKLKLASDGKEPSNVRLLLNSKEQEFDISNDGNYRTVTAKLTGIKNPVYARFEWNKNVHEWKFNISQIYQQGIAAGAEIGTLSNGLVADQGLTVLEYHGIGYYPIKNLVGHANYPDVPQNKTFAPYFEWPQTGNIKVKPWCDSKNKDACVHENYGWNMMGYISPPETGNYTFYIATDDYSELWLSSDDNPTNVKKVAQMVGWMRPRAFQKSPHQSVSKPIRLEAGQYYYIELVTKEVGGWDNAAVAWTGPGDDGTDYDSSHGNLPIPGKYLSPFLKPASQKLLAHWKFDFTESDGNFQDEIGGYIAKPINSGAKIANDSDLDSVLSLNGKSCVAIKGEKNKPLLNQMNSLTDEITFTFWQKNDNPKSKSSSFFGISPGSSYSYGIHAHVPWSDNYVYFDTAGCCSTTSQRIYKKASISGLDYKKWNHFAFVKKGNYKHVYINGKKAFQGRNTRLLPRDLKGLMIGCQNRSGSSYLYYLDGSIDDFKVYNYALSDGEISKDFESLTSEN